MKIQTKDTFNRANSLLEEGKVIEFCDAILDLFNKYDCNCFLKGQSDKAYERQMQLLDKFESNNLNYMVVKGFYYRKNNLQEKAYEILTNVIRNDSSNYMAYYFRSFIIADINTDSRDDAKNALILSPTARFYKTLADNIYEDKKDSQLSIHHYTTAIELNNNFACAYLNRGYLFFNLKDYKSASEDFKKSIEIEKSEIAVHKLFMSLVCEKKFREAEEMKSLNYKYFSFLDRPYYDGVLKYHEKRYEDAAKDLRYYVKMNASNEYANKILHHSEQVVLNNALNEARKAYKSNNTGRAAQKYKVCIENDIELIEDDIDAYFTCFLEYPPTLYLSVTYLRNCWNNFFENVYFNDFKFELEEFKIFEFYDVFKSGVHKGLKVSSIIEADPDYLFRTIITNVHFIINRSFFCDKRILNHKYYDQAVKANLVKLHIINKWRLNTIKDEPYREIRDDYPVDNKQNRRDTYDYLSDGQLGDYDNFDGDIDDVMDWGGH